MGALGDKGSLVGGKEGLGEVKGLGRIKWGL